MSLGELLTLDPAIGAAAFIGGCVGAVFGLIVGQSMRRRPIPPASSREVVGAYLLGYQDGAEGVDCDTTRPATLG